VFVYYWITITLCQALVLGSGTASVLNRTIDAAEGDWASLCLVFGV
jgi:hypothetical protein